MTTRSDKVTRSQISAVMAELGRRNAGGRKTLTRAGHFQRIQAARASVAARAARTGRPDPRTSPAPRRAPGTRGLGLGLGQAQSSNKPLTGGKGKATGKPNPTTAHHRDNGK
jgi:hypothetical protein